MITRATDEDKIIGEILRKAREKFDFSMAEVAEKVGVSASQYSKYEKGTNRIPLLKFFVICRALGVDIRGIYISALNAIDESEEEYEVEVEE